MSRAKFRSAKLAVFILAIGLSTCAMPEPPTRTALVYGVSSYVETWNGDPQTNPSPNLSLTDDDAADMDSMLSAQGWTTITRIADSTIASENEMADKAHIAYEIDKLAGTEGIVLFYYSGHGSTINGESAICPYGSILPNFDFTTYTLVPEAYITVTELYAMFKSAGLKHVIIILDSCYSGGFVEEGATVDAVPPVFGANDFNGNIKYTLFFNAFIDALRGYLGYSAGSGYIALSAAGAGELSWEAGNYGHGIFTYFLLKAGDGRADADLDHDGFVTTTELYAYCAAGIDANWNRLVENNPSYISDGHYGDYLPHLSGTAREYALWATN